MHNRVDSCKAQSGVGVSSLGCSRQRQSVKVEPDQKHPRSRGNFRFDATAGPSTIPTLLKRLRLTKPTPVVVILGSAGGMVEDTGEQVHLLFERSLAPVLDSADVVVITGGTDAGVMKIAGQTLSSVAKLIGVTPWSKIANDPSVSLQRDHHAHVLTSGKDWGSETDYMVTLATAITQGAPCGVVLVVGGGLVAVEEVNYFVEAGWPILSVAGTGGAADDLIAFITRQPQQYGWSSLKGADLGQLDLAGSPHQARTQFNWYMSSDELLKAAWNYYVAIDGAARRQRLVNAWIRGSLQLISLIVLSLVVIRVQANQPTNGVWSNWAWLGKGLHTDAIESVTGAVAVALPLALAAATAFSQTIAADRGWRTLRGAAEALMREIYRYRAWRVLDVHANGLSRDGRRDLKETIDSVLRRSAGSAFLLSIDLSSGRGRPKELSEGDDELGRLSVASYASHRIDKQIAYFRKEGRVLRRNARLIVVVAVLLAAVSGTLANTYFAPWAAIFVLGATAITAFLERSRLKDRADRYAVAAADLAEIKTELNMQKFESLNQPQVLFSAVTHAEAALEEEGLAWEQLVWKDVRESRVDRTGSSRAGRSR